MMTSSFVGRKVELKKLRDLSSFNRTCLVVIRGRRRIGKSRLIEEFAKDKLFLPFSGLAPLPAIKAQDQRNAFARQLAQNFSLPPLTLNVFVLKRKDC